MASVNPQAAHFHFKSNQVGFDGNARAYLGPDLEAVPSVWWDGESLFSAGVFSAANQNQYRSFTFAKKGHDWVTTTAKKLGLPADTLSPYFYTFPPQSKLTPSQRVHLDALAVDPGPGGKEGWRKNETYVAALKQCAQSIPGAPRFRNVSDLESTGFKGQLDVSTKHMLQRAHFGLHYIGSVGEGALSFIARFSALRKLLVSCAQGSSQFPEYQRIGTPWAALETVLSRTADYPAPQAKGIAEVLKAVLDAKIAGDGLGKPKSAKKKEVVDLSSEEDVAVDQQFPHENVPEFLDTVARSDPRKSVDAHIRMLMDTPQSQLECLHTCSALLARIPMGRHVLLRLTPILGRKKKDKDMLATAYNKLLYQLYSAIETCVDCTVREKVTSYVFVISTFDSYFDWVRFTSLLKAMLNLFPKLTEWCRFENRLFFKKSRVFLFEAQARFKTGDFVVQYCVLKNVDATPKMSPF